MSTSVATDIDALLAGFRELPTTVITDVMDRFGTMSSHIKPVWDGARLCAQAVTIWTREGDNLGIHALLKEGAAHGRVVVIAGGGFAERALLGDLIAERAVNAGLAGFVVDGGVRDVDGIAEAQLPVFAGAVVSAGPYKDGPYRLHVPVSAGGVAVNEGDIICGDADGVVVVPLDQAAAVLPLAQAKLQHEQTTRQQLIASRA